jgi:hypothetical protein
MGFDSDQLGLADEFDARQARAVAAIIVEPPGADRGGRGDDAHQALAQGIAPGAHRTHVAGAGRQAAHRVRVHEADDIAVRFFASQGPAAIGGDAGGLATAVAEPPTAPGAAAADADERP